MNLQSLRYFLEVARCLNFSRAAENLHISQPGLSQQIHALEEQLSFRLLTRTTRSVKLTKEGEFLYKRLLPSFETIEQTLNDIREHGTIPQKKISIAAVPSAAGNWIPSLVPRLRTEFGDVAFNIQETSSAGVIASVQKREADLGLFRTDASLHHTVKHPLEAVELTRHPVRLAVSVSHPLAARDSIDLSEVSNETFLHYDPDTSSSLHAVLEDACKTAGFVPKTMGTGPELLTMANLIAGGIGITLMPTDMIALLPGEKIKGLRIENQELFSSVSAVWNTSTFIPPVTRYALELLKESVYQEA
ncbi:LysR family transcriptional regulator [Alteribacter natronophilus]|uniref:LysR family transcriptional regulator n=1 Tax=Alteribacter natronophilus TaxID=2583810 RepID=UPI00110D36C2|nr:LysR family transcriptional regulator [Alteribacter natronophilus]TMW72331.1 LysR family transcriptional regulator [Alteribacter natronophilus]